MECHNSPIEIIIFICLMLDDIKEHQTKTWACDVIISICDNFQSHWRLFMGVYNFHNQNIIE